jgi:1,4-dihydroxy-2-naphthoate polyprenyltransferase
MKVWLVAARPKTLAAAVVPVWIGSVLAWKLTGSWAPWLAGCALVGALGIQIATNLFNDVLDFRKGADTEERLGPIRVTASGMIEPRRVVLAGVVALFLACVAAVPLILVRGWPILAIGLPSLYFSWGYTGGPMPLAYRGLGELFVMLFFGFVAVAGTVFVNTGRWFWPESLMLGFQVGCLSTALIAINNLRDVDEDRRTGKRTLAVRFGAGWARVEIAALSSLPWITGLLSAWWKGDWAQGIGMGLGAVCGALAIVRPVWLTPPSAAYNRVLALAGAQLVLFAAVFSISQP